MAEGKTKANKRKEEKNRLKLIKDTYYLIKWAEEDLYDVIPAKEIIPPNNCNDILEVIAGMDCRILYDGKYYEANVINTGSNSQMREMQANIEHEMEKSVAPEIDGAVTIQKILTPEKKKKDKKATLAPKGSTSTGKDDLKTGKRKRKPLKEKPEKRRIVSKSERDWLSRYVTNSDSEAEKKDNYEKVQEPLDISSEENEESEDKEPVLVPVLEPKSQCRDKGPVLVPVLEPKSQCRDKEPVLVPKELLRESSELKITELQRRLTELENTTKALSKKLKRQEKDIDLLKSVSKATPSFCSTPDVSVEIDDDAAVLDDDLKVIAKDKIKICGVEIDNLKYQSAILHKDPAKCALQLMDCLFTTREMVNGNPSGQSNSKDEVRKSKIKKLDPGKIKYIHDFVETKWPGVKITRKMTQKCTDLYNNRKDLRDI